MKNLRRFKGKYLSYSWKKRILLLVLGCFSLFFMGIILNIISLNTAEISLLELRKSYEQDSICHEDCFVNRERLKNNILMDLKKGSDIEEEVLKQLYVKGTGASFKEVLVELLGEYYDRSIAPQYLREYFKSPQAETPVQIKIIQTFPKSKFPQTSLQTKLKKTILDEELDVTERIDALRNLGSIADGSLSDYYLSLVFSEDSREIKNLAIVMLSSMENKERYFSQKQLAAIEKIALSSETEDRIRQSLVVLLADYYPYFPKEVVSILEDLHDSSITDNISLAFVVDFLNDVSGDIYPLPEISAVEWNEYYNN